MQCLSTGSTSEARKLVIIYPKTEQHKDLEEKQVPFLSAGTLASLAKLPNTILRAVEPIQNPYSSHEQRWMDVGMTKLRIWQLEEYQKVVYIDADCLVLEDLSHMFNNFFLNHECMYGNKKTVAFAPDIFPPDKFNAGVICLTPCEGLFQDFMRQLADKTIDSYDGGDTGFLNNVLPHWFHVHIIV